VTPHAKRPDLAGISHVTQKLCAGLPGLRNAAAFEAIESALRAGKEREGFRLLHFTVLSNHLHLIVEATDTASLSRGMQGLAIRVAKALNRLWGRRGRVFLERFFAQALRRAGSMRRALVYVLQNARRHGVRLPRGRPDPYSSAPWFRPWRGRVVEPSRPAPVVSTHNPTFEQVGWHVSLDDLPALTG